MSKDNHAREGGAGTASNGPALKTGTTAAARVVQLHRARKTLLRTSMAEIASGIDPRKLAHRDLMTFAGRLKSIAETVSPRNHATALSWLTEWRSYCFERSLQRWPDGLYRLLDRGYQPWRGHDIQFALDELAEIGELDEWDTRVITIQYMPTIRPLAAECFWYRPGRNLATFGTLIERIADAWAMKIANDRSNIK